jgi:hypothetical protein
MSENFKRAASLPFVLPGRKPIPEQQSISYARSGAPVLNFRKQSSIEPDDARITGTTRSLYRRLLALNLRKPVASERETEAYMPPLTA